MAIPDTSLSFRASAETRKQLADIQKMFERDRSWVLRKCVAVMWLILFDLSKLEQFIHDWQEFHRTKPSSRVAHQLNLNFSGYERVTFFPRMWVEQALPDVAAAERAVSR